MLGTKRQEASKTRLSFAVFVQNCVYIILGDPGADSGGEGESKQAGKYGTREK